MNSEFPVRGRLTETFTLVRYNNLVFVLDLMSSRTNALSRKRDFTGGKSHQRQLQSRTIEVIEDEVEGTNNICWKVFGSN